MLAAFYSAPTALMMMNLVWGRTGTQVPLDMIWQAILGVTDQYQRTHISDEYYFEVCAHLRALLGEHLTTASDRVRYTVVEGDDETTTVSGLEAGHIQEIHEFRFFLYRHWSLFDAMYHSPYIASKMPVWQAQGTVKLKELLAKMGVPLYQCNQNYTFMAPALKSHFRQEILKDSVKSEYNLQDPDVTYRSFFRYTSYKNAVGASDVVSAASALLEMFRSEDSSFSDVEGTVGNIESVAVGGVTRQMAFNEAYDCLSIHTEGVLKKGIQAALSIQRVSG